MVCIPMPRYGYVRIGDEHRYLTDFGYVLLDGPPEVDDSAFLKKMQAFSHAQWISGIDGPWRLAEAA